MKIQRFESSRNIAGAIYLAVTASVKYPKALLREVSTKLSRFPIRPRDAYTAGLREGWERGQRGGREKRHMNLSSS